MLMHIISSSSSSNVAESGGTADDDVQAGIYISTLHAAICGESLAAETPMLAKAREGALASTAKVDKVDIGAVIRQ